MKKIILQKLAITATHTHTHKTLCMDYLSFLLCLALAWIAIHFLISTTKRESESNSRRLPPGPSPLPIIGNLLSLGSKPHISLSQLANTYGPLMSLRLGQVPTVIISSAEIAKEALQNNDLSLSNRNVIDAVRALNHHHNSVIWLPVSPQWRNLRKICNSLVFSVTRLEATQSIRRSKVKDFISYVQNCSETRSAVDIGQAAFTTSLNLLSSTFFSVDLGDPSSKFAREFKDNVRDVMEELGKPNLSDYFSILRKIDPQGIRKRMSVRFRKMVGLFNTIIEHRLQSPNSERGDDVLDALLRLNQERTENFEPFNIPCLLQDIFIAGTDTTSNTVEWAMAELLRNPEKLKKAQSELDEIIGKGNAVEEADITRLPYLQAIVKETFRLHPVVPLLVPRKANSDLKVFGFTVPKNSQVLINMWQIGRDSNLWENPNSFQPERLLGLEIEVKGRHFELIPFGTGRRMCPGLALANRMIHLMLGSLIHEFHWELEGGASPEKMDMEERYGLTLEKAHPLRAIPTPI